MDSLSPHLIHPKVHVLIAKPTSPPRLAGRTFKTVWVVCLLCAAAFAAYAHPAISTSEDNKTLNVEDAPEETVYSFGKSVDVKERAKGVLAIGGDVIVEGDVDGDVGAIGGNVIQREGGRIGGGVYVVGGSYKPEGQNPIREPGKETVVFGVFEDEVRELTQNPSQLFAPSFTWAFLAQRILLVLFWFVISLVITTIAPGAVGRAVARTKLSTLKVTAFGSIAFVLTMIMIVGSVSVLPGYLSVTFGLMGILLLLFGYVFGRVTLQVSVGKWIQKHLLSEMNRSETLSTLLGVVMWTLFLSIPYVWLIALFVVFAIGIGLILTARTPAKWQKTQA